MNPSLPMIAALLASTPAVGQVVATTVATDSGRVRGHVERDVASWKGVPFAAPPIGGNRWREPQPISWPEVRSADAYGHDCMQIPFPSDAAPLGTTPSEDCLVLNIWRPATAATHLPVMVWIYGGGFVNGGSSPAVYSGEAFARSGVLLVSFNYRLGRFGFFAHPALTAAKEGDLGNYGYMDQLAALRWIQRNIAAFGGDPANVTVFGESAGGGSTLNILTSAAARGLFARVAIMSGGGRGGFTPPPTLAQAEQSGERFAREVGIAGADAGALARLRALPADQVLRGLNMATMFKAMTDGSYVGGPIVDGTIVVGTTQQALLDGSESRVPVLIGSNGADIGIGGAKSMDELFGRFPDKQMARAAYGADRGGVRLADVAQNVNMDAMMTEPARFVASSMTAAGQPAWYYRFDYVAQAMRGQWEGAPHATDIPYFFNTVGVKYGPALKATDASMARMANGYFVNFAKNGDPNGVGLPRWERYSTSMRPVLQFSMNGSVVSGADPWRSRLDVTEAAVSKP